MQLTELLFQKVKDLSGQGQLSFKPGYVAVVSGAPSLRAAILAPVCPAPDDLERLADGDGPTRVGVGLLSGDGSTYRLLRELGGQRQLLRYDGAGRKFDPVTDDPVEIDSFLRVQCGMPPADAYTRFFVLERNELPSMRRGAGGEAAVDQPRVKALQAELEATRKFEAMQDQLFKVAQRLEELKALSQRLREAEEGVAAVEAQLGRTPWSPEQIKDLTARAGRSKEDLKKRDDALAEIARKRQKLEEAEALPPRPFLGNPWFYGGVLGGAGLDALAVLLKRPSIALFGLLPFLAAAIAVLRWIEGDEAGKEAAAHAQELKEREASLKKSHEAEQAPLKAALKAARVDAPDDLLAVFREHEAVLKRREAALARLQELKADPALSRAAAEIPLLDAEKAKLEEQVQATGFSRPVAEIEADLNRALGISPARSQGEIPEAEVPKDLLSRAAGLLDVAPGDLLAQLAARFNAYLSALTDRRVASGKLDEKGVLVLSAADGRSGSYMTLPPPLRDLVYVALRLSLLERVAAHKRLPVVVDDAFSPLEAPKRALIGKMLKGISTQTQVIHRVAEAPAAGTADLVLSA
ncbi:MAG TPA: hypothetical protein VI356_25380 [Myxococcales bacterium]